MWSDVSLKQKFYNKVQGMEPMELFLFLYDNWLLRYEGIKEYRNKKNKGPFSD